MLAAEWNKFITKNRKRSNLLIAPLLYFYEYLIILLLPELQRISRRILRMQELLGSLP